MPDTNMLLYINCNLNTNFKEMVLFKKKMACFLNHRLCSFPVYLGRMGRIALKQVSEGRGKRKKSKEISGKRVSAIKQKNIVNKSAF